MPFRLERRTVECCFSSVWSQHAFGVSEAHGSEHSNINQLRQSRSDDPGDPPIPLIEQRGGLWLDPCSRQDVLGQITIFFVIDLELARETLMAPTRYRHRFRRFARWRFRPA
jgi:hypothetical protein